MFVCFSMPRGSFSGSWSLSDSESRIHYWASPPIFFSGLWSDIWWHSMAIKWWWLLSDTIVFKVMGSSVRWAWVWIPASPFIDGKLHNLLQLRFPPLWTRVGMISILGGCCEDHLRECRFIPQHISSTEWTFNQCELLLLLCCCCCWNEGSLLIVCRTQVHLRLLMFHPIF